MSPLFRNGPSQHIILRNVSNITFGPAYAFGKKNRRTFWKVWAGCPGGGKSLGVLGSWIWESHLHSRCHRIVAISIPTLAFMIYLAGDTAHCILTTRKRNLESPDWVCRF